MTLNELKLHLRITHKMEDELLKVYKSWAEDEIKDSVSTSSKRDETFFEDNKIFERAVVLLTSYYYQNRIAYDDVTYNAMPDGVLGAIQKLRGSYHDKNE